MVQFIGFLSEKESHGKNLCLQVKPVIKMLKQTLVGTGALLVTAMLLFIFATPVEQFFQSAMPTNENPAVVLASKIKKNFNLRYIDIEIPTLFPKYLEWYHSHNFLFNMQKGRIASTASGGNV